MLLSVLRSTADARMHRFLGRIDKDVDAIRHACTALAGSYERDKVGLPYSLVSYITLGGRFDSDIAQGI